MKVSIECPVCGKPQDDYITVTQVARLLGKDDRTIRGWVEKGRFPGSMKVGPYKIWRIPASVIRPLIG